MNEDWARRENQILSAANERRNPDTIHPPLNDEELERYNHLVKTADIEQAKINIECAEKGIAPWPFSFEMMEVD